MTALAKDLPSATSGEVGHERIHPEPPPVEPKPRKRKPTPPKKPPVKVRTVRKGPTAMEVEAALRLTTEYLRLAPNFVTVLVQDKKAKVSKVKLPKAHKKAIVYSFNWFLKTVHSIL